jgi:hypothetical protein
VTWSYRTRSEATARKRSGPILTPQFDGRPDLLRADPRIVTNCGPRAAGTCGYAHAAGGAAFLLPPLLSRFSVDDRTQKVKIGVNLDRNG